MAVLARNGLRKSDDYVDDKAKRRISKQVTRKQSTPNVPKNEHFLPHDTHTYVCVSGDKKCAFSGKFGVLCFLVTSVLRFAVLPYLLRLFPLTLIIEF